MLAVLQTGMEGRATRDATHEQPKAARSPACILSATGQRASHAPDLVHVLKRVGRVQAEPVFDG